MASQPKIGEEVEEYLLDRNIVQPISFEVVVEHGCTD